MREWGELTCKVGGIIFRVFSAGYGEEERVSGASGVGSHGGVDLAPIHTMQTGGVSWTVGTS